ncbi:MAG: hypothetical protein PHE77_01845 [Candidatus Pacebacteria bacterium]|nr:hypothetical protein [Candidatus Paceibacterota bacterium]
MPRKIIFKLLLALIIPLLLAWAISSISEGNNLYFFQLLGFITLIVFGVYVSLTVFFRFGRSMNIVSKEKNLFKKIVIFAFILLLLVAILIGIDKFFETAFKFIGK